MLILVKKSANTQFGFLWKEKKKKYLIDSVFIKIDSIFYKNAISKQFVRRDWITIQRDKQVFCLSLFTVLSLDFYMLFYVFLLL